tara:strand:- start:207 stop:491 length:285 start_codon:yes stop_codon:yes gene_type:complete
MEARGEKREENECDPKREMSIEERQEKKNEKKRKKRKRQLEERKEKRNECSDGRENKHKCTHVLRCVNHVEDINHVPLPLVEERNNRRPSVVQP